MVPLANFGSFQADFKKIKVQDAFLPAFDLALFEDQLAHLDILLDGLNAEYLLERQGGGDMADILHLPDLLIVLAHRDLLEEWLGQALPRW